MPYEFKMDRRVAFAETDMAGILHFSNFYRYMKEAEHAFFRSLGLSVHPHSSSGELGWVRAEAACRFLQPLRYEDIVDIHVLVTEKRSRSITYAFVFSKAGIEVARGSMAAVCITKSEGEGLHAIPMPANVDAAIQVAPTEVLDSQR